MRNAETLLDIIGNRGIKGSNLEDVYRQLFNPELYLMGYGRIYRNAGAMTKGINQETVDGMSLAKINDLIEAIRYERHRWTPVRRVLIPKSNGKMRPLGIPTWTDKLLQEVIRSILNAYYEPQFSEYSHGFRPGRGCHTALDKIRHTWTGTKWFIEGDIEGCFDNIDHPILLSAIREKIQDNRFIRLLKDLIEAGYVEEWKYNPTHSGTPQGGIVSPLLANIYLDKLDKFVEQTLIPEFTKGTGRRQSKAYTSIKHKIRWRKATGQIDEEKSLRKSLKTTKATDSFDPNYRRLRYVRYADDFLLGLIGSRDEAEAIKDRLKTILRDNLKLELSEEKTLITHARTERARFLGYEISVKNDDTRRRLNGSVTLRIPSKVLREKCQRYTQEGKPSRRTELLQNSDFDIIATYGAEYRGVVEYYKAAENLWHLNKLRWVMETSMLKTLAMKFKTTSSAMSHKYRSVDVDRGELVKSFTVTIRREGKPPLLARFGGISLKRTKVTAILDGPTRSINNPRNELIKRLLADRCELCGSNEDVEVHHIRGLKDLKKPGRREMPAWKQRMCAFRRKTLVLCKYCHDAIHKGRPTRIAPA